MTRQEQKTEAIARMQMLKLHKNPIREFIEEDVVNLSEGPGIRCSEFGSIGIKPQFGGLVRTA